METILHYTAITNNNGVATVKVDLNTNGTYSFIVKFLGDNTYKTTSQNCKTNNIIINKSNQQKLWKIITKNI